MIERAYKEAKANAPDPWAIGAQLAGFALKTMPGNLAEGQALILSESKGGFYLILTSRDYTLRHVRNG